MVTCAYPWMMTSPISRTRKCLLYAGAVGDRKCFARSANSCALRCHVQRLSLLVWRKESDRFPVRFLCQALFLRKTNRGQGAA